MYGGRGATFGIAAVVYNGADKRVPYSLRMAEGSADDAVSLRARGGLLGSLRPGRNVIWLDVAVHTLGVSLKQCELVVGGEVRALTVRCSDDAVTRHYLSLLYGGGECLFYVIVVLFLSLLLLLLLLYNMFDFCRFD